MNNCLTMASVKTQPLSSVLFGGSLMYITVVYPTNYFKKGMTNVFE